MFRTFLALFLAVRMLFEPVIMWARQQQQTSAQSPYIDCINHSHMSGVLLFYPPHLRFGSHVFFTAWFNPSNCLIFDIPVFFPVNSSLLAIHRVYIFPWFQEAALPFPVSLDTRWPAVFKAVQSSIHPVRPQHRTANSRGVGKHLSHGLRAPKGLKHISFLHQ